MVTLGFSHYNLRASRELLETLRAFYCDVVGLRAGVRPPFNSFGYWLYAGERDVLHLSESTAGEARSIGAAPTFDHAAFNCSGRIEFERKLARLGIEYEVAQVPLTGQVQLFFKDPAGNGVELNFAGDEARG
ncbi:MAG TPA: VOC family protein [Steroidobacteraceae bacterium]|jgi:catechol 2,3-dioxygenase-like lactoylglutathione lyase family enzyme